MVRLVKRLGLLLAALLLAGCARAPDADAVREAVQQQIDLALGAGVLKIDAFRRAGSQPLAGRDGRLVYFNAQLQLQRDQDFTSWDGLNIDTLRDLLGAGPQGLSGVKNGGNRSGELLGVYGSVGFVAADGGWRLVETAPAPAAAAAAPTSQNREAPAPTAAEAALARLQKLIERAPGDIGAAQREAIVTQALDRAYRDVQRRLARSAELWVLAGGPSGGAYAEVAQVLAERAAAAGVALDVLPGDGSVANVRALRDGSAQFALVQNDIAAQALAGTGPFAAAAMPELRALASLFPEAVQLVVRADSALNNLADLRGKRVDLGLPESGTRSNALAVLAAHGLSPADLGASSGHALGEAAALLAAGHIDALFTTVHAPARALQAVAVHTPLRWVDLPANEALRSAGLLPLRLPARSYAGQDRPVQTLTATALLATRADLPPAAADAMLKLLFDTAPAGGVRSAAASQIDRGTAAEGVTLPWYPGAEALLAKEKK